MKAQASIEYLMVFGIAIVLSAPFILKAQESMLELRTGAQVMELENSVERIEAAVETVNAAGKPARRTFQVEIPEIVTGAELKNETGGLDGIIYSYNSADGSSNIVRTFSFNISGNLPQDGRREVTVSAVDEGVNISVG